MKKVLFITLFCSTLFSVAQDKVAYLPTQRAEMVGYMFSVDAFDWYFVPCSDSSIYFLDAIAKYSDKSFWLQHSLGCGEGSHYSYFSELGNRLVHPFKYSVNSSVSDTVRYFYSKIWIDLDTANTEYSRNGLLTTIINKKEYLIGCIFYTDNELIEIEPYNPHIRKMYLQKCYNKKLPLPDWVNEKAKTLIKPTR